MVGNSDEVTKLMDRVEVAFIKHFSNSNRKKGLSILRPTAQRRRHRITAFLAVFAYLGYKASCRYCLLHSCSFETFSKDTQLGSCPENVNSYPSSFEESGPHVPPRTD